MAAHNSTGIDTPTKRRKLFPRREPYFYKLGKGQHLGFRKLADGGSWIARATVNGAKKYTALGKEENLTFEDASKMAAKWFSQIEHLEPGQDHHYTVKSCVDDYVEHIKIQKGENPALYTHRNLDKHLTPALGDVELSKLTTAKVKRWRDGLVGPDRQKDTVNRIMNYAKAAFNLAYRNGLVGSDTAWKRVRAFENVGQNRKLFLTDRQVAELLAATTGNFHNLVKAGVLTGARYGELAALRVRDLDQINGTLRLDGKTGARDCYLSDDALTFFKSLSKSKLPNALLLPRDDGDQWGTGHQFRRLKEAVQTARLPAETVFYSLRHYHISKALLAHIPAQVIAENCGTSIRMLEKHYGKFMATDRRKMMNQVEL